MSRPQGHTTPDLIIRDGIAQDQRFPKALTKGYFNVNETGLHDIVARSADHAGLLTYFGPDNRPVGDWTPLFDTDDAMVLARIKGADIQGIIDRFHTYTVIHDTGNLFLLLVRMAEQIDAWYRHLSAINSPEALQLTRRIHHIVDQKLRKKLNLLEQFYHIRGRLRSPEMEIDFGRFSAIWQMPADEATDPLPNLETGRRVRDFLKACFFRFHNAMVSIRDHAATHLETALKSKAHDPSAGLFLAFAMLLENIRDAQNRFTLRHLAFYYNRVLRCRPADAVPDTAHLCFKPAPDNRGIRVPRGTRFEAGVDGNGDPRYYAADSDLKVTMARVVDLRTLFFEKDRLMSPELELDMITSGEANQIPLEPVETADGEMKAWPVLGAARNKARYHTPASATLGFALASPILLMREGEREIKVGLALENTTVPDEPSLFFHFLEKAAASGRTTPRVIFYRVFSRMFTIRMTTADGWVTLPECTPLIRLLDPELDNHTLCFTFKLYPDMPAVAPYSEAVHKAGMDTAHPVVRFEINPETYVYPVSLLVHYMIREVSLDIRVKGVRNLVLYNDLGRLDPNSRFLPFGPLPAPGAFLIAGCYEAAVKPLTHFRLHLTWAGLPRDKGGFEALYRAYDGNIDNHVFKAGVSCLKNGDWEPKTEAAMARISLFNDAEEGEQTVSPFVTFETPGVDFSRYDPIQGREADFACDIYTKSGFFKFTLTEPATAFGHKAYPLLLTDILTKNNRLKAFKTALPLPNAPYAPLADAVSADYAATAYLTPGRKRSFDEKTHGEIFNIHPFGMEKTFPLPLQTDIPIIPNYQAQGLGSLFIGLADLVPGTRLTLFFNLKKHSHTSRLSHVPQSLWFYLGSGRWKPFKHFQVVSDTTFGFLRSGIITLDLPRDMDFNSRIFNSPCHVIRVCADRELRARGSLISLHPHGVSVTLEDPDTYMGDQAPKSIGDAVPDLPGLGRPDQPELSFGGRIKENQRQYQTRVSERLKHKLRAITPWDYERLILEQFPGIYKVKCFPNLGAAQWRCWETRQFCLNPTHWFCDNCLTRNAALKTQPGHLLIAVVAGPPESYADRKMGYRPMADPLLLDRIREYAASLSTPFARIDVRNPVYEKIQVRCMVKFNGTENPEQNAQRLDRGLSEYLSPWRGTGMKLRFGWCVQQSDILAHIRRQPYVDFVTDFSMLRIVGNGLGKFELFDSIPDAREILPKYPWSIAVPAPHHFIRTTAAMRPVPAEKTGVDELEVGDTFIITG